uniref:Uncharacterized protein n=1 Tax=Accipiter nisus TaxID=211598 RepID=A0A8B9M4N6_9AVES
SQRMSDTGASVSAERCKPSPRRVPQKAQRRGRKEPQSVHICRVLEQHQVLAQYSVYLTVISLHGELGKHEVPQGMKATTKYTSS